MECLVRIQLYAECDKLVKLVGRTSTVASIVNF